MPGFDRTGPFGAGPRTGRGMGFCGSPARRGSNAPGGTGRGMGRGGSPWGGGRGRCFGGRGMGFRRWGLAGPATVSPAEETETLRVQLAVAEDQIAAMKARLEELEEKGQSQ